MKPAHLLWLLLSLAAPLKAQTAEIALSNAYSNLSLNRTPNASDRTRLIQAMNQLKPYAHALPPKSVPKSAQPALRYLTLDVAPYLTMLEQASTKRSLAQSQYTARRILMECSSCHASQTKPAWMKLAPNPGLNPHEAAEFYMVSGNSSQAMLQLEKMLADRKLASSRPQIWTKAATQVVALGIETSGGPFVYVDIISNLLATSQLSAPQKALLTQWRTTGKAWGNERDLPSTPDSLVETAKHLIGNGDILEKKSANFGLVHYARAMSILKRIQLVGSAEQKASAFALAGQLREKITVPSVWLNPEDYYEACIRVSPHTPEAAGCWNYLSTLSQRNKLYSMDSATQQLQNLSK